MPFIRWLLALIAIIGATAAVAQDYPARPAGPVLDQANILPPQQEAALDARLRAYNARTGRAIVVATVPSLGGEPIETYAVNLFQQWGIGGAQRDQGLLLLVAPSERKVRIEVGYGLTPYVTDILSGRIIRDTITPAFRSGDFAGGIDAGVGALLTQLDRSPEDAAAIAEAAAAAEQDARGGSTNPAAVVGGAIFWGVLILGFALLFGRKGKGRRRHRRYGAAGAVGDVLLWSAVSSMMNNNSGGWGGGGGGFGDGGGGGFGGFGGGMSGGGGASGSW